MERHKGARGWAVRLVAGQVLFTWVCAQGTSDADRTESAARRAPWVLLGYERTLPIPHGARSLKQQLKAAGYEVVERELPATAPWDATNGTGTARAVIVVRTRREADLPAIPPEGFRVELHRNADINVVQVVGGDACGAMYGAMELGEQIRDGGWDRIHSQTVAPRFPFRAIKFNLPWMSYRRHEALQLHDETCRSLEFWNEFLDLMAENRFNTLTLWSLHPFTLMIRPKEFPEACGMSDQELARWQHFWRQLLRMARERGISVYMVNWNIFVSPEFARARGVSPLSARMEFFGEGDRSELVERYTRQCVTQVLEEYPDLAGLGVTLGEGMGGMTPEERKDWIERTIIAGMRAAQHPVRLIYRAPLSATKHSGGSTSVDTEQMTRRALEQLDLPTPIWLEFKFNWSHGHSSPRLSMVHGGPLTDTYWNPPPKNYRIVWTIRNEDFFILRWGQPEFIREHIQLNGHDYVGGYIVGSECYIPARDYLQRPDPRIPWRYAFQRQWLFYKLWGRLLYDPTTPDRVFARAFDERYGVGTGEVLLPAFSAVSRMPLLLASVHKGTWDFTLYCEGFLAPKPTTTKQSWVDDSPFISVDELINQEPLDPSYMSIAEFVRRISRGEPIPPATITPWALADDLERNGQRALALLETLRPCADAVEFEIADVRIWARLCLYFAEKLRAGVALQTYRVTGRTSERDRAIRHLRQALEHWTALVEQARPYYGPVPLIHTGSVPFSWELYLDRVRHDVTIAETAHP